MDVQFELPIQWYFFTDIYTELGLGKKGRVRERATRLYPDDISPVTNHILIIVCVNYIFEIILVLSTNFIHIGGNRRLLYQG